MSSPRVIQWLCRHNLAHFWSPTYLHWRLNMVKIEFNVPPTLTKDFHSHKFKIRQTLLKFPTLKLNLRNFQEYFFILYSPMRFVFLFLSLQLQLLSCTLEASLINAIQPLHCTNLDLYSFKLFADVNAPLSYNSATAPASE